MRAAFTVIELLVAIVILGVGVLALAATAGLVASQVGEGGRLTAAAYLSRSVLDSLATRPCAALASGSTQFAHARAEWQVARDSSAAVISLTVDVLTRRGVRRHSLGAAVPCDSR